MRLSEKIYELLGNFMFSKVPRKFISKDELFQLTFDDNWVYSRKGNSFYNFHNTTDNLKGGLQFSFTWDVTLPETANERDAMLDIIYTNENGKVEFQLTTVSDFQAIHYCKQYAESNMSFHYWYIYHERILVVATFMIFNEEAVDVKDQWLQRVVEILGSLKMNDDKFRTTRMR